MSEQENGNPTRFWGWLSPRPGVVFGYTSDEHGRPLDAFAVVKYAPITAAEMRGISMTELDNPTSGIRFPPGPPPDPIQLQTSWDNFDPDEADQGIAEEFAHKITEALQMSPGEVKSFMERANAFEETQQLVLSQMGDPHLSPDWLQRIDGEDPADFYWRVSRTYEGLAARSKTPVRDLADLGGFSHSAATAYVHRARERGYLPAALKKGQS